MLRKFIIYFVLLAMLIIAGYISIIYYFTLSDGVRSGILSKFSNKGLVFKTWEGELNEGFGATKFFQFSVLDSEKNVIEDLKKYQGKYVKLEYKEKIKTLPWWGDTNYYIVKVTPEKSPY